MKKKKMILTLLTLTILTGCDSAHLADQRIEQNDRLYKAAMDDYRAGRLDVAMTGFEKSVQHNPSNASARFQLGCLLQDSRKDYLGAYCCYREYLLQRPTSDKAKLAKDRLAICEREAAKELSVKYGLNEATTLTAELDQVRKNLKDAEERLAKSEKEKNESLSRVRTLTAERERLLAVLKGFEAGESTTVSHFSFKEAKELLEEEDEESTAAPSAAELKELAEEEASEQSPGSSIIPTKTVKPEENKPSTKSVVTNKTERPKTYLVQEGDTLYGVSKRFYGTISMWKKIRDANKTLISTDNRLHVGDTIVLPEP